MNEQHGVLLFAHGARDPAWARPFEAVAARLREARPGRPIALAYLELMAPDLLDAGARLVAEGCSSITVVPLFLGAGGHVKRDLPRLLETLQSRHPTVRLRLAPAIGETDSVIAAIADAAARAGDAAESRDPLPGPR